jgi:predicted transcriptional regulator
MSISEKVAHFLEEDSHVSQKLFEIRKKIELLKETKEKKKILKLAQLHVFNEKGVKKVVAGSIEMNKIEDVIFIEVEELNREK